MRIAIVHENWGAGAARCARDLERGLRDRHEVLYFPRHNHESRESIRQGLAAFRPDIVNCHSFYGGLPYGLLAEISQRYATCFTVHDPRPIGSIEPECWGCSRNDWCLRCPLIRSRWHRLLQNKYLLRRVRKRATHRRCANDLTIVTPSAWMAAQLRDHELKRFRVIHIPNGIDLEEFRPVPSERARFGLPEEGFIFLHLAWHVGGWSINKRKGLHLLADAFQNQIAPQCPNAHLAVAGESLIPNHPRVIPLGMISEGLPSLLASVDVFVTSTLGDNLPYTVLEAMACGKPVVASDVGGIPEQVDHGTTGYLASLGNPSALSEAMLRSINERSVLARFGKAGREKVENVYAMGDFLSRYESLFHEVADARRNGANT